MENFPSRVRSSNKPDVQTNMHLSLNSWPHMKQKGKLAINDVGTNRFACIGDLLEEGTILYYVVKGERKGKGIVRDGCILCLCCHKQVTPTEFEKHAGFASRKNPYHNILTLGGESLEALRQAKHLKPTLEQNVCTYCSKADGLFWCKKCCQAFHAGCVGLSSIPKETWCCAQCCNMYQNTTFQGHTRKETEAREGQHYVDTIGSLKYDDIGRCAICSCNDFTEGVFNDRTVIICDLCQKEYHVGCLREYGIVDLKEVPKGDWFCCEQCRNINSTLSRLIKDGEQGLPEYLLYRLKKKNEMQAFDEKQLHKIKWRLLRGKDVHKPTTKLLSDAISIFHDQFGSTSSSATSKSDLIKNMVHGAQFGDHNFNGMYCAILMVKSMIVSAALFRIIGEELVEIPLVATKKGFEDKGYFESLFSCLKNLLASQNIKRLVLLAETEVQSIWKYNFGFEEPKAEQAEEYENIHHQISPFEKITILHKLIPSLEL